MTMSKDDPVELPPWCAMAEAIYQGILSMTQEQRDRLKVQFTERQWKYLVRNMPW